MRNTRSKTSHTVIPQDETNFDDVVSRQTLAQVSKKASSNKSSKAKDQTSSANNISTNTSKNAMDTTGSIRDLSNLENDKENTDIGLTTTNFMDSTSTSVNVKHKPRTTRTTRNIMQQVITNNVNNSVNSVNNNQTNTTNFMDKTNENNVKGQGSSRKNVKKLLAEASLLSETVSDQATMNSHLMSETNFIDVSADKRHQVDRSVIVDSLMGQTNFNDTSRNERKTIEDSNTTGSSEIRQSTQIFTSDIEKLTLDDENSNLQSKTMTEEMITTEKSISSATIQESENQEDTQEKTTSNNLTENSDLQSKTMTEETITTEKSISSVTIQESENQEDTQEETASKNLTENDENVEEDDSSDSINDIIQSESDLEDPQLPYNETGDQIQSVSTFLKSKMPSYDLSKDTNITNLPLMSTVIENKHTNSNLELTEGEFIASSMNNTSAAGGYTRQDSLSTFKNTTTAKATDESSANWGYTRHEVPENMSTSIITDSNLTTIPTQNMFNSDTNYLNIENEDSYYTGVNAYSFVNDQSQPSTNMSEGEYLSDFDSDENESEKSEDESDVQASSRAKHQKISNEGFDRNEYVNEPYENEYNYRNQILPDLAEEKEIKIIHKNPVSSVTNTTRHQEALNELKQINSLKSFQRNKARAKKTVTKTTMDTKSKNDKNLKMPPKFKRPKAYLARYEDVLEMALCTQEELKTCLKARSELKGKDWTISDKKFNEIESKLRNNIMKVVPRYIRKFRPNGEDVMTGANIYNEDIFGLMVGQRIVSKDSFEKDFSGCLNLNKMAENVESKKKSKNRELPNFTSSIKSFALPKDPRATKLTSFRIVMPKSITDTAAPSGL